MKYTYWKIITLFISIPTIFFSRLAIAANLKDAFPSAEKVASSSYDTSRGFYPILGSIISIILSLLGIVFVVFIIYAGYLWMTASGNEQKVDKAMQILKESIIGLVIVVGAYAISYFVINSFASQLNIQ